MDFPPKSLTTSPRSINRRTLVVGLVVIALLIAGGGHWYYLKQAQVIYQNNSATLASIAAVKVAQIKQWRTECLIDITRNANSPTLIDVLGKISRNVQTPDDLARGQKMVDVIGLDKIYVEALVLSPAGKVLFHSGKNPDVSYAATQKAIHQARTLLEGVISDFYRGSNGEVYIDTVSAFRDGKGNVIGYTLLRSHADDFIYPLIQSWPTPSPSAESLLVQRDGDGIVFLNELRHRANTALSLRQPLSNTELPAVQAVLGRQGLFEGRDYRKVPVLAELCAIPQSPWFLVAKVDEDEMLAEARYRAGSVTIISGILILFSAAVLAYIYSCQQSSLLQRLLETERQKQQLNEQTRLQSAALGATANAIFITNKDGVIEWVNQAFVTISGYSPEEVIGKTPMLLRSGKHDPLFYKILWETILSGRTWKGEMVNRHKNGTLYTAEKTITPIKNDHGEITHFIDVAQDISARKRAEEALRTSEARFKFALQTSQIGVWELNLLDHTSHRTLLHDSIFGYETLLPLWTYEMFLEHVLPEDRPDVDRRFREAVATKTNWGFECRIRRTDGVERWIWAAGAHEHPLKGEPTWMSGIVQDITERKHLEDLIRRNEERLSLAARAGKVGIWDWDIVNDKLTWDESMYSLYDVRREDFKGAYETWLQTLHPDDREKSNKETEAAIRGEREYAPEYRIIRRDGEIRYIKAAAEIFHDLNGNPIRMIGTNIDITELKLMETKLREAQNLLQAAMDQSPAGIAIADAPDCKMRYVNDVGLSIRGLDHLTNINGMGIEQYVASRVVLDMDGNPLNPRDIPLARAVFDGETSSKEFIIRRSKQDDRIILAKGAPIKDENGKITAGIAVFMDITEERKLRDELQKSQNLLQSIVNQTSDYIYVKDLSGNYILVNPAIEKIFNKKKEDILGKDEMVLFSHESVRFLKDHAAKVLATGELDVSELTVTLLDGKQLSLIATTGPIFDGNNRLIGIFGVGHDISEIKRLQNDLSQQLEDRVCQELVSMHFSMNLLAKLPELKTGKNYDLIKELNESCSRALDLTRSIVHGLVVMDNFEISFEKKIQSFAKKIENNYDIQCNCMLDSDISFKNPETFFHLFRIVQESVAHTVKHAHPKTIGIEIHQSGDKSTLEITNDGESITPPSLSEQSFYVDTLRHRAKILGGKVVFKHLPNGRALVKVSIDESKMSNPELNSETL